MVANGFGSGQVLWSLIWFSLFFLWMWLIVIVFADIIRSRDLSGWGKGLWSIGIIILPILGIFLYLIVNGDGMHGRDEEDAAAAEEAVHSYIRTAAATDPAEELVKLATLHETGALSDVEYEQAKARAMST